MALAGRSCRTRDDREAIAFGKSLARAEAMVSDEDGQRRRFLFSISRADGRRHLVDGAAAGPESAAQRPALAVFMPDRLALVKGPPAARRNHIDGFCAALWPARAETRRALLASARPAQCAARPDSRRPRLGTPSSMPGTTSWREPGSP